VYFNRLTYFYLKQDTNLLLDKFKVVSSGVLTHGHQECPFEELDPFGPYGTIKIFPVMVN